MYRKGVGSGFNSVVITSVGGKWEVVGASVFEREKWAASSRGEGKTLMRTYNALVPVD